MESTQPLLRQNKKSFIKKLCSCFQSEESASEQPMESLTTPSVLDPEYYPIKNFAARKLYLLGGCKVLASFKHVLLEVQHRSLLDSSCASVEDELWRLRYHKFSKYDEGVKMDQDSWQVTPHEKIVKYLAKTICAPHTVSKVIDGLCGVGGFSVHFAKHCKVVGIDIDDKKIEMAKVNAGIYKVAENTEFIVNDFLEEIGNHEADLVILQPSLLDCSKFTIESIYPNLTQLVRSSLQASKSILIYLPPNLDATQVAVTMSSIQDLQPYVEFSLMIENSHLRGVTCLVGCFAEYSQKELSRLIASRLNLSQSQNSQLQEVLSELSLSKVLSVLQRVEEVPGGTFEELSKKAQMFFELAQE